MKSTIRQRVARSFGKALRTARGGLTREALAERSTVKVQQIQRYEDGQREPRLSDALLLAKALPSLSLDDIKS